MIASMDDSEEDAVVVVAQSLAPPAAVGAGAVAPQAKDAARANHVALIPPLQDRRFDIANRKVNRGMAGRIRKLLRTENTYLLSELPQRSSSIGEQSVRLLAMNLKQRKVSWLETKKRTFDREKRMEREKRASLVPVEISGNFSLGEAGKSGGGGGKSSSSKSNNNNSPTTIRSSSCILSVESITDMGSRTAEQLRCDNAANVLARTTKLLKSSYADYHKPESTPAPLSTNLIQNIEKKERKVAKEKEQKDKKKKSNKKLNTLKDRQPVDDDIRLTTLEQKNAAAASDILSTIVRRLDVPCPSAPPYLSISSGSGSNSEKKMRAVGGGELEGAVKKRHAQEEEASLHTNISQENDSGNDDDDDEDCNSDNDDDKFRGNSDVPHGQISESPWLWYTAKDTVENELFRKMGSSFMCAGTKRKAMIAGLLAQSDRLGEEATQPFQTAATAATKMTKMTNTSTCISARRSGTVIAPISTIATTAPIRACTLRRIKDDIMLKRDDDDDDSYDSDGATPAAIAITAATTSKDNTEIIVRDIEAKQKIINHTSLNSSLGRVRFLDDNFSLCTASQLRSGTSMVRVDKKSNSHRKPAFRGGDGMLMLRSVATTKMAEHVRSITTTTNRKQVWEQIKAKTTSSSSSSSCSGAASATSSISDDNSIRNSSSISNICNADGNGMAQPSIEWDQSACVALGILVDELVREFLDNGPLSSSKDNSITSTSSTTSSSCSSSSSSSSALSTSGGGRGSGDEDNVNRMVRYQMAGCEYPQKISPVKILSVIERLLSINASNVEGKKKGRPPKNFKPGETQQQQQQQQEQQEDEEEEGERYPLHIAHQNTVQQGKPSAGSSSSSSSSSIRTDTSYCRSKASAYSFSSRWLPMSSVCAVLDQLQSEYHIQCNASMRNEILHQNQLRLNREIKDHAYTLKVNGIYQQNESPGTSVVNTQNRSSHSSSSSSATATAAPSALGTFATTGAGSAAAASVVTGTTRTESQSQGKKRSHKDTFKPDLLWI